MNSQPVVLNEKNKIDKKYWLVALFLLLAVSVWLGVIFFGDSSYADESDHLRQIHRFMKGNYEMMSSITTLPGYHLVVAFFANFFDNLKTKHIRLISLALSLFSIPIFYLTAKKLKAENPLLKTFQYVFLPISFFYFPLVYTDIFSLLWILTAFYFALGKKYSLSAFFLLISLLVRQNNIVWVAFFWVYTYISENKFSFSWKKIADHLKHGGGYVAIAVLFLVFTWMNKGVSIGDRERQQVGFYMGNIYFFLALVGFLFLPVLFSYFNKFNRSVFKKNIIWGALAGIVFACLFIFSPPVVHEYNMKMKFLRNIILWFAYHKYVWAYALAIFLGCISLVLLKFEKKSLIFLPFAAACLFPSLLVEQRYSIIPLVLVLLFRKELGFKTESAILLYFILLSGGLVYMLLHFGIFF